MPVTILSAQSDKSFSMTPKGWYPDPVDPTIDRYWDGNQWTASTLPKSSNGAPRFAAPNPQVAPAAGTDKKTTGTIWKVCGALVAFFVVVNVVSGTGDDDNKNSNTASTRTTSERTVPRPQPTSSAVKPAESVAPAPAPARIVAPAAQVSGLGKPVRDGKFEFLVSTWDPATATAHVRVTNIGDRPQSLAMSVQYLYDKQGRKFEPEFDWTSDLAFADLNPGQSVSGNLTYILSGAVPDRLELHDSIFSGGADVPLG